MSVSRADCEAVVLICSSGSDFPVSVGMLAIPCAVGCGVVVLRVRSEAFRSH
jgi:hypothetical protein